MNIYISGISGTGMGPLALMASDAGHTVYGSDLTEGPVAEELRTHGINFEIGPQDGSFLKKIQEKSPIDWFVYTSALPDDHPELILAKQYGLKISKRDEFISFLVSELGLKMVAVAGTHGKTTTTAMLIWACQKLGIPASYLVGTTLPFAPAGKYTPGDIFFIYEADEYDRNFLHFHPWLSLIPSVSYDHPDIYNTPEDYQKAFAQFESQSKQVIHGGPIDPRLTLAGALRRQDATLALRALTLMITELRQGESEVIDDRSSIANGGSFSGGVMKHGEAVETVLRTVKTWPSPLGTWERSDERPGACPQDTPQLPRHAILDALNTFPGAGRRFERLKDGVYSDYAHHPEEISATIKMALEEAKKYHKKGIVALYQPHQNTRQHQVRSGYKSAFEGVTKLYWLPTYLTREDESLPIITPEEFINDLDLPTTSPLDNRPVAEPATLDDSLADKLKSAHAQNYLILLLTAGPADTWFRHLFS